MVRCLIAGSVYVCVIVAEEVDRDFDARMDNGYLTVRDKSIRRIDKLSLISICGVFLCVSISGG